MQGPCQKTLDPRVNSVVIVLLAVIAVAVCVGAYMWFSQAKEPVEEAILPPLLRWQRGK